MTKNEKKIKIYSALEVANICGVVNQTAINWIRNGYLKAFTTPGGQYRVYAEDLMAFLDMRGMRIPDGLNELLQGDVDWTTVLIVDDDKEINTLLKKFIEKHFSSLRIIQAYDGFEAGKELSDKRPGFVFLDIDLPGINGFKLCKKIKEEPVFGKPFIIAITGLDNPDVKEEILNEGADAFFSKPCDYDEIMKTIEMFMEKVKVKV